MSIAKLLHFSLQKRTRTDAEVDAELDRLDGLFALVPGTTALGNSNRAALRAGISVLIKRLKYDEVEEEYEGNDDYVLASAIQAAEWLWGGGEPVSKGWEHLAGVLYASRSK